MVLSFQTAGFYVDGQWDSSEHGSLFGFSTYDNEEGGLVSGGVAYIQRRRWLRSGFLSEDRYLNVALGRFLFPHFSLGLSVTWLENQVGRRRLEQWNGVVGILHNPRPRFRLGTGSL